MRDDRRTDELLSVLIDWYEHNHPAVHRRRGGWPNRKGEYEAVCPYHNDATPGATFSFGRKGHHCFACGRGGGLEKLAEALGITASTTPIVRRRLLKNKTPVRESPAWTRDPDAWRAYTPPSVLAEIYYEGRGISAESVAHWKLGSGVLPASRCPHERAILPVFDLGGRLVALKGRAIHGADQDQKWLQAAGGKPALYGAELVRPGVPLILAEAPYGVILGHQYEPACAYAAPSGGASTWLDIWSRYIARKGPSHVLVFFDHDEAGDRSAGRVAASLTGAGQRNVRVYHWRRRDPKKADLPDLIAAALRVA